MTFFTVVVRGLTRQRARVVLTALAATAACVGFILIQTIGYAWTVSDGAAADRVVTRHALSLQLGIPINLAERLAAHPSIERSSYMSWFGARVPARESEEFTSMAVEPNAFLAVFAQDYGLEQEAAARWQSTREGAIVGEELATNMKWKVGDAITLEAPMWPVDDDAPWKFVIVGIYKPLKKSVEASSLFIRYDYFNARLTPAWRDQVRLIMSSVKPNRSSAVVAREIDAMFSESTTPTLTTDEATFSKGFLASVSALITGLNIVSLALLSIATLLVVSLVTISTRERVREFGVLRAIGFSPFKVCILIIGEPILLSVGSGVAACGVAAVLTRYVVAPFLAQNAPSMFPTFPLSPTALVWVIVASLLGGLLAGAFPAITALRVRTTDALRDIG